MPFLSTARDAVRWVVATEVGQGSVSASGVRTKQGTPFFQAHVVFPGVEAAGQQTCTVLVTLQRLCGTVCHRGCRRPALCPMSSANSPQTYPTQAFRSEVQLLQWTMATGLPVGVATMSRLGVDLRKGRLPAQSWRRPTSPVGYVARTGSHASRRQPCPCPRRPPAGRRVRRAPGRPAGSSRSSAPASASRPASAPAGSSGGSRSAAFQGRL